MKIETIKNAIKALGFYPFREESSYPLNQAQRNLSGRTHYVDDDTLKGFGSRILETHITDEGLFFGLVESVKNYDGTRYFRPVIFDVFGTVANDRLSISNGFKTRKQAAAQFWIDANALNASEYYADVLARRVARLRATLKDVTSAMSAE